MLMADTPTMDNQQTSERRAKIVARLEKSREPMLFAAGWAGHRAFRLGGEILSVCLALGMAFLYFFSGLAARQSADLSALRPNFEIWFSQSFNGATAELGDLELRWNPADDTVSFTIEDVRVFDQDGGLIQTLPSLKATTTQADLLRRQASLRDIEIEGGIVSWVNRADGTVIAGLGSPDTVGGFGPVYEGRNTENQPRDLAWLEAFHSLSLKDSQVHIVDETDNLSLVLDVQSLIGTRDRRRLRLDLSSQLSGGDEAGKVELRLRSEDALQSLDLELSTNDLRLAAIAAGDGRFSFLNAINVPLNADMSAQYSQSQGLLSATMALNVGSGSAYIAGQDRDIKSGVFQASLRPGEELMQVETFVLSSGQVDLEGEGVIREIGRLYDGDVGTSPKFDLQFSNARLDLTPIFEAPVTFETLEAAGELDIDSRTLTLDRVDAGFGHYSISGAGVLATSEAGVSQVRLTGQTRNATTAPDLLALWPVAAADGARRWIDRSVLDGTLHNVRFDINLDESFFVDQRLTPERLQLEFDVQDGMIRYISTMEVLSEAVGSGRINGNSLGMVLQEGRIGDVIIRGGDVNIPRLIPKGGDILITAEAEGQAQSLLRIVNQPPFQYLDRYGVDPEGFSGTANVTLNVKRPLLEFFDQDRIEYGVEGRFQNASAPFQLGPHQLSNADVTLQGGKEGLFMTGEADIGPWRTSLTWEERYGRNGEPTRYRLSGPMDQKVLDGFGFGLRQLFGGTLNVDIEASGQGLNVTDALVDLDLSEAEMSFGELWSKEVGVKGTLTATVNRSETGVQLERVSLQAPGLEFSGSASLRPDLALEEARLERVQLENIMDGAFILSRDDENERLALQAKGAFLEISDYIQQALANVGEDTPALPISVDASFEQLVIGKDYALSGSDLTYRNDGVSIERMSLAGQRPDGPFSTSLSPVEGEDGRVVEINIPDVSLAATAILGLTATQDGSLQLSASLPAPGEEGPIVGQTLMEDFTVSDAPFLAQILSLASLTGILDTLSGEGLSFDELSFDFAMQDRELSIRDAIMRGPAIGMTGDGDIDLEGQAIDFSGTLVPAYTANSLLGDIPLIGDIFVGRDGEGVFAVNYGVNGPYSEAQISINPLSALTPGFIRGIFREDRDDIPGLPKEDPDSAPPED